MLGYFYFRTKKGKKYLNELVDMSDTLVIDGKINTVISGTSQQRELLKAELNKLEEAGIVEKTTLKVNYAKLGYDITAFIGIFLQKSALYDQVMAKLKAIPEITSIHYTTGNYSMFTKIHCKDTNHLKLVLHDKIQQVEGIERTETMISLEESLDRSLNLT